MPMQDYDIFNLIRSKEIREYFRKNWRMNIEQKLSLIARSYVDISVKSSTFGILRNNATKRIAPWFWI